MIPLQGPSQIITNDETLAVCRDGSVTYVDGKPVKGNIIQFKITCNVQPLNGRELMLVPELDRYKEQYWVWMNQQDTPLEINDTVLRPGLDQYNKPTLVSFQVQEIQNWGSYTQAKIMRRDVGPNAKP